MGALKSLFSRMNAGDLWCIRTFLSNGVITIDTLKIAIATMTMMIGNVSLAPPMCDFLLETFELEPGMLRCILDKFDRAEANANPREFAARIFKYEHNGSISTPLLVNLPLDSFIEYVQLKDLDLKALTRDQDCWGGSGQVIEWILSVVPLDNPQDIIDMYKGDVHIPKYHILIERLVGEFAGHVLTQKALDVIQRDILHIISSRFGRVSVLMHSVRVLRENGYFITDPFLARAIIYREHLVLFDNMDDLAFVISSIDPETECTARAFGDMCKISEEQEGMDSDEEVPDD